MGDSRCRPGRIRQRMGQVDLLMIRCKGDDNRRESDRTSREDEPNTNVLGPERKRGSMAPGAGRKKQRKGRRKRGRGIKCSIVIEKTKCCCPKQVKRWRRRKGERGDTES